MRPPVGLGINEAVAQVRGELGVACAADSLLSVSAVVEPADDGAANSIIDFVPNIVQVIPEKCGFVSRTGADAFAGRLWVVEPKIPGTAWLELYALAEDWNVPAHFLADLDQSTHESAWLLLADAYVRALEGLFRQLPALRRMYDPRAETLTGRVRGKLDLPHWASHIARGQVHRLPCRFSVLDTDNRLHRSLRWALHIVIQTAQAHGHAKLVDRCKALDARFVGVTLARMVAEDLRESVLPRGFEHYDASCARPIARFVLRHLQLQEHGGNSTTLSLVFEMWKVYEDAFFHAVHGHAIRNARTWPAAKSQHPWEVQVGTAKATSLQPDVFVYDEAFGASRIPLVLDTKWKWALAGAAVEHGTDPDNAVQLPDTIKNIRLDNKDLYQALAYAHAAALRSKSSSPGAVAVLVYPVVNDAASLQPIKVTWSKEHSGDLQVFLASWNVARGCTTRFGDFAEGLARLAEIMPQGSRNDDTIEPPPEKVAIRTFAPVEPDPR